MLVCSYCHQYVCLVPCAVRSKAAVQIGLSCSSGHRRQSVVLPTPSLQLVLSLIPPRSRTVHLVQTTSSSRPQYVQNVTAIASWPDVYNYPARSWQYTIPVRRFKLCKLWGGSCKRTLDHPVRALQSIDDNVPQHFSRVSASSWPNRFLVFSFFLALYHLLYSFIKNYMKVETNIQYIQCS